jgi:hypothetical protein
MIELISSGFKIGESGLYSILSIPRISIHFPIKANPSIQNLLHIKGKNLLCKAHFLNTTEVWHRLTKLIFQYKN